MLKFVSFGSGSSGNCYLLYTETDALMIDCGIGIRTLRKEMLGYGLKGKMIHNIIITHDHADHVKSVGAVSSKFQLPVYATRKVHEGIWHNWCVKKKIEPQLKHSLEKNKTIEIGEFKVTAFDVPHDSTDCVGYQVIHDGVNFTIVTDCGHITDEIKTFISSADYLVIEANHEPEKLQNGPYPAYLKMRVAGPRGHLSNEECAKAIAENASPKLKHVWLCHLSDENNHPELARKSVETVLRSYGIVAGTDFKLDVLKRKTPSEIFELSQDEQKSIINP